MALDHTEIDMTGPSRLSCSRYVGRVGTLAVTLGVGIGIAVTPASVPPVLPAVQAQPFQQSAHHPIATPVTSALPDPQSIMTAHLDVRAPGHTPAPTLSPAVHTHG